MPKTIAKSAAHIIREPKERVQRYFMCLMNNWSDCGVILDEQETDPRKKHKCGDCPNDYAVVSEMIRDGLIKREEAEQAGMLRPTKRRTQKRVLSTILARRSA